MILVITAAVIIVGALLLVQAEMITIGEQFIGTILALILAKPTE